MDCLKEKLWNLNDIFEQFLSVFVISITTMCIAAISPFIYMKALIAIANFRLFNTKPYFDLVVNNYEVLKFGIIIIPIAILIIGFDLAYGRYQRIICRYRYR
ncbi:hypothetical protein [Acinetobacter junii]|uniref:hypothetical protein n=1 Tax=Acinetobacter junii TaxID=40215 RepID=UPI003A89DB2A